MPPAGMPRPDAATTAGFIRSLERQLDAGSAARASHSRPDPAAYLPPDGSSAGFDNNAGAALADARANLGFQIGDGGFARTDRGTEEDAIAAIRLFLDAGADVNVVGNNGETPLHAAAARDGAQIIRYLVQRGAKLDAKDRSGRTPLDVARGVPAAAGGRGGRGGGGGQAPAPGPRREKAVAALEGLIATPSP